MIRQKKLRDYIFKRNKRLLLKKDLSEFNVLFIKTS
jgi:hypothetical protein